MPVTPIAQMLLELGKPPPPAAAGEGSVSASRSNSARSDEEMEKELEQARKLAHAEGYELGRAEQLRSERQLADRLSAEQEVRFSALARDLLSRLDEGIERVHAELSATVGRVLVAFFKSRIEQEAIEALAAELDHVLADKAATRVMIRGPQEWLDRLKRVSEDVVSYAKVEIERSESLDVSITVDQTIIETTVGAWTTTLAEVS